MSNLRAALRGRMTRTALAIGLASTIAIYVWVVVVEGDTSARHEIAIGGVFALLISSVGDRPIGIQASQIAAVARWANAPVTIEAFGPRSSLIAKVAAELDSTAIASVNVHGALSSLKQVITDNMAADKVPELFCFGLLESMQ